MSVAKTDSCNNKPFFSILMPCYNAEKYLEACLESIYAQTYSSWEIVAVDDGSTDRTYDILLGNKSKHDEQLIIRRQRNSGQLLARINAASQARGEYILYVDADDMLRSDALECLHEAATANPQALICFKASRSDQFEKAYMPDFIEEGVVDISWLRRKLCSSNLYNSMCCKAFPSSSVKVEIDFEKMSGHKNGEDAYQLTSILDQDMPVVLLNKILYYYRTNPESVTSHLRSDWLESVRIVNVNLREHAERWGDSYVRCLDSRWLHNVYTATKNIVRVNGFSAKAREELKQIRSDELFANAWAAAAADISSLNERIILSLLHGGFFLLIMLCVAAFDRALPGLFRN